MMSFSCDECGSAFSLSHALDCYKGGLVTQRHDEVRDALGDFAALALIIGMSFMNRLFVRVMLKFLL